MRSVKEQRQILVISTSFPVNRYPASGVFVERLVRALSEYYCLTVITPCDDGVRLKNSDAPYLLSCFRYAPRSWQVLAHAPGGIVAAIRHNPFCLLLVPGLMLSMLLACFLRAKGKQLLFANWSICGLISGLVGRLRGIPVITTLRGSDVNRVKQSLVNDWLLGMAIALSHRTVTVSAALSKVLSERYPRFSGRICMIPNGIDENLLFLNRLPPQNGIKLRLVFIGNLISLKGVETILRALASLPADIVLKVVGEGAQGKTLEAFCANSGINPRVSFTGALPPETIPMVLQESDVLVSASYSEGRPNVVLEGLAAGVAIIATNIDGTSELIEDGQTGLLFSPGDVKGLCVCINKLYQDPALCRRLGEQGRAWIREQGLFWHNTAMAYARVFEEVIAENPRR